MLSKVPLGNAEKSVDKKNFPHFVSSPLCSYSSSRHQGREVKDYVMNLEVEGKVSVLMGLAEASAKYQHKDESSTRRELMSLSCSVYARKGYRLPGKETPTYSDKGMNFSVEGIEIGMEDILIVTTEHERNDMRTENTTEIKARVIFFSISAKMKSIHQSSQVQGFVQIDHYSSFTREWKRTEFSGDRFDEALAAVERIENYMCNIPNFVNKHRYEDLPHMRLVLRPNLGDNNNIALYLELQGCINAVHIGLAGIRELKKTCNDSVDKDKVDKLTRLLEDLENVDVGNCSWEYLQSVCQRI
ncbi:hypothetical protein ACROYT_G008275 [Oculina patagonica]